jgi:hypothetical protein
MEFLICSNNWTITTKLRLCNVRIPSNIEVKGTADLLEQLLWLFALFVKKITQLSAH